MTLDRVHELPGYATRALRALEAAGFEAWAVGGWVRDELLGSSAHDVDLTCSARWTDAEAALVAVGIEVHETGTDHGTVTAVVEGNPIEITTYRVEGAYSDLRHPDEVRFVDDVREDLARRDFTINAMAWHPERGLLDPFGGARDLELGVIRAVGDPDERLSEDALRVLRAVRFACRLGFTVEPATQAALSRHAPLLAHIAQERIGQELDGIVRSGHAGWALMEQTDVICAAVPEIRPLVGYDQRSPYHVYDVLEHTAHVVNMTEALTGGVTPPELAWASLLHDIAKPVCATIDVNGRGHFFGHPAAGADMCERIMRRLAMPHELVRPARALVRLHDHVMRPTPESIRKTLAKLDAAVPGRAESLAYELLVLKRADALSKARSCAMYAVELDQMEDILRREIASGAVYRVSDLAVSGADIVAAGIRPGPAVGEILRSLLNDVIDGDMPNEREALLMRM